MRSKSIFLLLSCFYFLQANAQSDEWAILQERLEPNAIIVAPPLENQFQFIADNNMLTKIDFAISQRKGAIEIRYLIKDDQDISYPHINVSSLLTTLATNDTAYAISVLPIEDDILEKDYNADWGMEAFFKPKISFSKKEHGKLVAIYKEGQALIYMVLLFDEPTIDLEPYEFILTF